MSIEASTIRKPKIRLPPFLFLLYVVAFLDRINIGFAALTMNRELAITSEQYGFVAGIFFVGYFLFENALARTDPRCAEESLGTRSQALRLSDQALVFRVGVAENVTRGVGVRGPCRTDALTGCARSAPSRSAPARPGGSLGTSCQGCARGATRILKVGGVRWDVRGRSDEWTGRIASGAFTRRR